jgi:hypothetical protein
MLGSMAGGLYPDGKVGVLALVQMDPQNVAAIFGFAVGGFDAVFGGSVGVWVVANQIHPGKVAQELFHLGPTARTVMAAVAPQLDDLGAISTGIGESRPRDPRLDLRL